MAKKKTPEEITRDFDAELIRRNKVIAKQVDALYAELIYQIAPLAAAYKNLPSGVFSLSKLPTLNRKVDQLIKELNSKIEVLARSGINDAWALSNNKNDFIADIRLSKSIIPSGKQLVYYDTNAEALKQYQKRKVAGLNLSERIYKQGQRYKLELEAGIGEGIAVGRGAAEMGISLKQYLNDPDTLFRRVRDAKGVLKLSKNAKAFHPGQGVYRSASKNIKRLTRTENNTAYRASDNARYQQSPFIIGFEVKTSASHPKLDICDYLKGRYPVGFIFIGWHPQCLCFSVPVLMTDEQFGRYQQLVISGKDSPANVAKIANRVMTIPPGASTWLEKNKERIEAFKTVPLWYQQNKKLI